MKILLKKSIALAILTFGLLFGNSAISQTSCCASAQPKDKTACGSKVSGESTSGCTPSNCRGAKTKFGEAKVISALRADLIGLKAVMEKSENPKFEKRSYGIHGIVGETDDESLTIIKNEIILIEKAIKDNFQNTTLSEFVFPESKSKQVQYLDQRMAHLKKYL